MLTQNRPRGEKEASPRIALILGASENAAAFGPAARLRADSTHRPKRPNDP